MKYRAEIDGLRAIAVVPVVLFHAGFQLFSGGYVGVDVFFVISGYLITSIILNEMHEGRFSLWHFYERRARRILPLLLLVLATTYAISWFVNLPSAHKVVGQYVVSSIAFFSNILLYLKGRDYFGLEGSENPLFHTWSLAVEEQYYILFPLVLILLWRFGPKAILGVLAALFVASLALAQFTATTHPMAAFFLLPTRIWEILLGAFCAFYLQRGDRHATPATNQVMSLAGIVMIIYASITFDEHTPTPSLATLIPTLGTAFIILFATRNTLTNRLLSTPPIVFIGLISYSLYLWHQPLLTFAMSAYEGSTIAVYATIAVVFIVSVLSWRYWETPFRRGNIVPNKPFVAVMSAASIALIAFGITGHFNNGFVERNALFAKLQNNSGFGLQCNGNFELTDKCASGRAPSVAVLGNSYSMQFVAALSNQFKGGVVQLTQDSCKLGYTDTSFDINAMSCPAFYRNAVETIKANKTIEFVFVSSPFAEILDDAGRKSFGDLLDDLSPAKIVILGPTPTAPFDVGNCFRRQLLIPFTKPEPCDFSVTDKHFETVAQLTKFSANRRNVTFIDITPYICTQRFCAMHPEPGLYMYRDTGHLTQAGADRVTRALAKEGRIFPPAPGRDVDGSNVQG